MSARGVNGEGGLRSPELRQMGRSLRAWIVSGHFQLLATSSVSYFTLALPFTFFKKRSCRTLVFAPFSCAAAFSCDWKSLVTRSRRAIATIRGFSQLRSSFPRNLSCLPIDFFYVPDCPSDRWSAISAPNLAAGNSDSAVRVKCVGSDRNLISWDNVERFWPRARPRAITSIHGRCSSRENRGRKRARGGGTKVAG